jgi:hypothetical protein
MIGRLIDELMLKGFRQQNVITFYNKITVTIRTDYISIDPFRNTSIFELITIKYSESKWINKVLKTVDKLLKE